MECVNVVASVDISRYEEGVESGAYEVHFVGRCVAAKHCACVDVVGIGWSAAYMIGGNKKAVKILES